MRPPEVAVLRRVRGTTWPAGTVLRRGYRTNHRPDRLAPGTGNTRFAPLDDTHHAYVAVEPVAALLESVLHDINPVAPRIRHAVAEQWSEAAVALTGDVRLADLSNTQLDRVGVGRHEIVATEPRHYVCTRRWADALKGRGIGGHIIGGIVWDSRRQELHAAALDERPAMRSVLKATDGRVAVLWSPPLGKNILNAVGNGLGPLTDPVGDAFLSDLAALLGIVMTG